MSMVMMIESKLDHERVGDVQKAVERMLVALDAAQPEGLRYAACVPPDGDTIVALVQVADGVENPLPALPEYKQLLEIVEGSRAAPPRVERWTVIGSYGMF